jgi:N6-L-threonylcarbamoyladenine synthase
MLILGIESSCDETAAAVVEDGHKVLSSIVASQTAAHEVFGGVVPEIAAREHLKVILPTYELALAEAGIRIGDIDGIAVTQGPGLIGSLLVGISFAKGLAFSSGKPLIPVDHVNAHLHGALLGISSEARENAFPAIALVVSGGHTNLYYMEHPTDFGLIATSIDDACGECFDKVGKMLGLPYPGGPRIEAIAVGGDPKRFPMPQMVQEKSRLEYSYSGLKTHMLNTVRKLGTTDDGQLRDLCAGFQREALGQLIRKFRVALARFPKVRSILIAGGVAANKEFRRLLAAEVSVPCHFPDLKYCSDNAAMIAALGWYQFEQTVNNAADPYQDPTWDAYPGYDFVRHFRAEVK